MNGPQSQERSRREGRIFARGKRGTLWIGWHDDDGGHRLSTNSRDPRVADRKLRERLAAKDRGERYVRPTAKRVTVGDLLDGLRDHHALRGTKSWPRMRQALAHVAEHFGRDACATKIVYSALEAYAKARMGVAKPATTRFELALLSQAFKVAVRSGRITAAAVPPFPTITVRNVREVTFTDKELVALLGALPGPVRAVAEFASLVGWRLEECLGLRWEAVNFDEQTLRLKADETKTARGRVFPFAKSPRVAALLERQRQERWRVERERGVAVEHVFHRNGKRVANLDDAWRAACEVAELEGRHFHDLRRYACARMIRAGLAPTEVMALMGHRTLSMHLRYSICDLPMLEQAVAKLARLDT